MASQRLPLVVPLFLRRRLYIVLKEDMENRSVGRAVQRSVSDSDVESLSENVEGMQIAEEVMLVRIILNG